MPETATVKRSLATFSVSFWSAFSCLAAAPLSLCFFTDTPARFAECLVIMIIAFAVAIEAGIAVKQATMRRLPIALWRGVASVAIS